MKQLENREKEDEIQNKVQQEWKFCHKKLGKATNSNDFSKNESVNLKKRVPLGLFSGNWGCVSSDGLQRYLNHFKKKKIILLLILATTNSSIPTVMLQAATTMVLNCHVW